jgi:uncharacterized phage protein (TIGR01671 family)
MRDYLFRGKRKDDWRWEQGDYGHSQIMFHSANGTRVTADWYYISSLSGPGVLVDPETVSQYTGRDDKNGVKIFEGDIMSTNETDGALLWTVEYDAGRLCYEANGIGHHYSPVRNAVWEEGTVIGNIHDNPELLGGGKK